MTTSESSQRPADVLLWSQPLRQSRKLNDEQIKVILTGVRLDTWSGMFTVRAFSVPFSKRSFQTGYSGTRPADLPEHSLQLVWLGMPAN